MVPVMAALLYTVIRDPLLAVPLILVEATGFAMLNPALFAIVAAGSPTGRPSTAQGVFGASGTLGFVVASLVTGALAEIDIRLPFYVFASVMMTFTTLGFAVAGASSSGVGGPGTRRRADHCWPPVAFAEPIEVSACTKVMRVRRGRRLPIDVGRAARRPAHRGRQRGPWSAHAPGRRPTCAPSIIDPGSRSWKAF